MPPRTAVARTAACIEVDGIAPPRHRSQTTTAAAQLPASDVLSCCNENSDCEACHSKCRKGRIHVNLCYQATKTTSQRAHVLFFSQQCSHNASTGKNMLTWDEEVTPLLPISRDRVALQATPSISPSISVSALPINPVNTIKLETPRLCIAAFKEDKPLPWMIEMMNLKKECNFFKTRVIECQSGGALAWH